MTGVKFNWFHKKNRDGNQFEEIIWILTSLQWDADDVYTTTNISKGNPSF